MFSQALLGNILVVDADVSVSDLLRLNLRSEGYNVMVCDTPEDVDFADLEKIHLIIADGGEEGLEFISDVKSTPAGPSIGVIYCSSIDNERLLIDALDAGADDVLRKPFSLREMIARVRAVMRRRGRGTTPASTGVLTFRHMHVDLEKKSVTIAGESVVLSNTEFAILELLLRNANTYTPRIEIFKSVWRDAAGSNERIVDTNISRLRRKLGELGTAIVNRSGLGYMMAE